jgi:hypothetical protein
MRTRKLVSVNEHHELLSLPEGFRWHWLGEQSTAEPSCVGGGASSQCLAQLARLHRGA